MNIGDTLTRKLGPLPTWGWGVALGGGLLVWRFISGGKTSGQQAAEAPTFVNPDPNSQAAATQGFLNDLTAWMQRLEDRLAQTAASQQPPASTEAPTGTGNSQPPTTPPPASAPVTTSSSLRAAAYNYAQSLFALKLAPNPGSRATWETTIDLNTDPFRQVKVNAYNWAQAQFAAGKAPNPGSFATYSSKYPAVTTG